MDDVICPRCASETRWGLTRLSRVCTDCSRRVFVGPGRGSHSQEVFLGVAGPLFAFEMLLVATVVVAGDGLSSLDPAILASSWGTFVVWFLGPSEIEGTGNRWLEWIRR